MLAVLLGCLRGLTKREREAALYYLSRFATLAQIPAIEASAEDLNDEHYRYSVKCTVNQIRRRFEEEKGK